MKTASPIAFTLTLLIAAPASAFTEDVCYTATSSGSVVDCTPLPAACQPVGTESPACSAAAIVAFAKASTYPASRSSIHVDATFILAQAAGFSFQDSYWISAYSEAVDQGQFLPRDNTGAAVDGTTLQTAYMNGLERTDFTPSGGVYIHFQAPYNPNGAAPVPGLQGLDPDPSDTIHEVMLSNLRAWAMAGSGTSRPSCGVGLTMQTANQDYSSGTACYTQNGAPASVVGSVSIFDGAAMAGSQDIQTFTMYTGPQIVQDDGGAPIATSDDFDMIVSAANPGIPNIVADARLAVYIHSFGDRVSHHVCLDQSYMTGPAVGSDAGVWTANMTNDNCAQGLHCLRHIWEHGVTYADLSAQDRTTSAYFADAVTELGAFATARGVANATYAPGSTAANQLVADLIAAEQLPTVTQRLAALNQVTCSRGFSAFPGQTPCTSSSSSSSSSGSSSGASSSGSSSGASSSASTSSGSSRVTPDTSASKGCAVSNDTTSAFGAWCAMAAAAAVVRLSRRRARRI